MRGTHCYRRSDCSNPGIIPAYAGNTDQIVDLGLRIGDHPRVCGEHAAGVWSSWSTWGSSPRMRGTRVGVGGWNAVYGIIPAYAGNTGWTPLLRMSERDHPRVCGEHSFG